MGLFDDLIPAASRSGGLFADLIPPPVAPPMPRPPLAPTPVVDAPGGLASVLMESLASTPAPDMPLPGMEAPAPLMPLGTPEVPQGGLLGPDPMLEAQRLSAPPERALPAAVPDQIAALIQGADPSSIGGDLEAAWLQAQQIIPGLGIAAGVRDLHQAADPVVAGELGRALGYEPTPDDLAAQLAMQESLGASGAQRIAEALPGVASLSEQIAAIPMNPAARRVGEAETFGEGLSAAADDPLGVLRSYGVRSLGTSVPSMLAAIVGSIGGPMGAAVGAGATGGGIETSLSVASDVELELRQAGVDVSSPEAVAAFVNANPEAFDGMLQKALGRAGIIGAVDAATGGATAGLARAAVRSGKGARIGEAIAAGGAIEPVGEGAGEAAAGLATEGRVDPAEVLAEMLGGAGIGVPTTAGQVAVEAMRQAPAQPIAPAAGPPEIADLVAQYLTPPEASRAPAVPGMSADRPEIVPPGAIQAAPTPDVVAQPPAPTSPQIVPQEPYAQTAPLPPPSPSVLEGPQQNALVLAEPAVPDKEPPAPQRKPFTNLIRRAGIQVDPRGPAGQELRSAGLTNKTHPGLFRIGAHMDLDAIPAREHPELAPLIPTEGESGYFSPAAIIEALSEEAHGRPVQGADQLEVQARYNDWQALQTEQAENYAEDPDPLDLPEPTIQPIADDMRAPTERTQAVQMSVNWAVQRLGLDKVVTPDERSAIVARLDQEGGSIEQAIERELIRSVLNAESGAPLASEPAIPGFEAEAVPGAVASPGTGGVVAARDQPVPAEGSEPGGGDRGRAGQGPAEEFPVERTPEGEQLLVPGTEVRQTGEAQRQKAEIAARQQQSKMRRLDQKRIEDDESSLFGAEPVDLFAPARVETAASEGASERSSSPEPTGRAGVRSAKEAPVPTSAEDRGTVGRPKGKLSPRFLDFSFTNRASVYGAAFRAAGLEPDEARNLPIDEQIKAVAKVLTERFGVQVEFPKTKVQKRNLVGRKVTAERQSITTREGLDQLLDAFRNMQMLAAILGVPEKALALELDGKPLTLSLVSVKKLRGGLGLFSWGAGGRKVTLPGRSNSFAHEWGHALDHYLNKQAYGGLRGFLSRDMDEQGVQRPLNPKAALVDAFAQIMRALYVDSAQASGLVLRLQMEGFETGADGKPTPAALRARKIMTGIREGRRPPAEYLSDYFKSSAEYDRMTKAGSYFTDPAEMFARAFEAWVGRTVSDISDLPQGFLSKSGWGYDSDTDDRLRLTFPKEADAAAFTVAVLELSHAMNRVALFPGSKASGPEDMDIYSDGALLKRLPKLSIAKKEAAAAREMVATWRRLSLRGTASGIARGASNFWADYLTSLTATIHAVAARQTDAEAKRAIQNIADMIGNDPGSGRLISRIYQQDVEMQARRNLRKMDGALAKEFRGKQLTEFQSKKLRELLTGQKVQADPGMKRLAADLRTILDAIWYDLKKAGIEVGYAAGYLPRIPNLDAVDEAPGEFTRDAAKVYALMFEREVTAEPDVEAQREDMNTVIRRLRNAVLPTAEGETEPASRLDPSDEALIDEWRKAPEKKEEGLRAQVLTMLQSHFADYSAENWRTRMRVGNQNDFDTMGPQSSFLKGRSLPPETDAIMERWLQNDPIELIAGYIHAAARRAEYAKRFGRSGEKLENMLSAAEKGGATSDDIHLVRKAVNSATGRFQHPSKGGQSVSTAIFFLGTLSMLGRATFSSIAEPITAGLRSGFVRDSAKAVLQQLRTLAQPSRREDLFELARVIGLLTTSMHESVMANRLGADSAALSKGASTTLAKFFQKSLLTPLTSFQRAANVPVAHAIVLRHLKRKGKFSDGELNELGIAKEDRADLLQWLEGLKGLPNPEDLLAPDGSYYNRAAELWANAVVRLTDQTIQNPNKSDRPIMANHPMVASLYGIMSFIMSFQRNILVRTVRRGTTGKGPVGKTAQVAANLTWAAPAIAALFAGQFLSTAVRELLFNADTWKEKDDDDELLDWLLQRAFWRTGLAGVFDPLAQYAIAVRYERDLTAITAGPYAGFMLGNIQKIVDAYVGRNSPNTNTAEFNALRALYQLSAQPLMMWAISSLGPAGPITGLLSTGGIWYGSSPQASAEAAGLAVGDKGSEHDGSTPWWETAQ